MVEKSSLKGGRARGDFGHSDTINSVAVGQVEILETIL